MVRSLRESFEETQNFSKKIGPALKELKTGARVRVSPCHNRAKARTNPDAIPLLVKNFKKDALGQPF
jgi:hypothetical protein